MLLIGCGYVLPQKNKDGFMKISQGKYYKVLKDITSIPTAPFHESSVARYIRYFADREGLQVSNDKYGNLFVVYRGPKTSDVHHPVGMVAHMDHPGFEIIGRSGRDLFA